jgi:uncharacterized membrane protein
MKLIITALVAIGLIVLTSSLPASIFTSKALASKMDGKGAIGGCSDRACRGINRPTSGAAKNGKKPNQ